MYLIFDTFQEAEEANNQISKNMELCGDVTAIWDNPQETSDGKFVITKPEDRFIASITGFQEVENYTALNNSGLN